MVATVVDGKEKSAGTNRPNLPPQVNVINAGGCYLLLGCPSSISVSNIVFGRMKQRIENEVMHLDCYYLYMLST